jgi:hypothetical protein
MAIGKGQFLVHFPNIRIENDKIVVISPRLFKQQEDPCTILNLLYQGFIQFGEIGYLLF